MKLTIFSAGSMQKFLKRIMDRYMELNPDIQITLETNGSIEIINKITLQNQSADYLPIDLLMFSKYATWSLQFASNKMVLIYTDKSKLADEINEDNWHEIISNENVRIGSANPDKEPGR